METREGKDWLERDKESKRRIDQVFELENEIQKEYGRAPTLEEHLAAKAMCLMVKGQLKKLRHSRTHRRTLPFRYRLLNENKDADFLILINLHLAAGDSRRERLKTAVHETLHYIYHVRKTRTSFESMEDRADTVVDDFVKKVYPHVKGCQSEELLCSLE